jgi:hypothetical protein
MRTYLKIEGKKRQGRWLKITHLRMYSCFGLIQFRIDAGNNVTSDLKAKDGLTTVLLITVLVFSLQQ